MQLTVSCGQMRLTVGYEVHLIGHIVPSLKFTLWSRTRPSVKEYLEIIERFSICRLHSMVPKEPVQENLTSDQKRREDPCLQ
jgi:hypothetical protein